MPEEVLEIRRKEGLDFSTLQKCVICGEALGNTLGNVCNACKDRLRFGEGIKVKKKKA